MYSRYFRFLSFVLLVAMAGCTSLPFRLGSGSQVTPSTTAGGLLTTPSSALAPMQTEPPVMPEQTAVATQPIGESMVRIWLPPEFDPDGNNPASNLLKARLEEFATENQGIRGEVRVKALEGAGGLLESLVAANVAAPLALPDLVLLPRPLLESAALKGLLYPYDGLSTIMDDPNWYEYAEQLAHVQSSTYGIPFAGDALVLAYHPALLGKPSIKLEDTLSLGDPLLYPATDPQALFTLCLYLAENGSLQDPQGRPSLDVATLTKILDFDQRASLAGVMPYWLTQYSNDAQVWEAFNGGQYPMAVTWASTYLSHFLTHPDDLAVINLPTVSGTPFTLATGWSWALASQNPEHRAPAVKLAEYLVDKEFLGKWTYAAGYLPPNGIPLQYWPNAGLSTSIAEISKSASLVPPVNVLSDLGVALERALVDVLKAQSDPQTAAQSAIDQINQP